MAWSAPSPGRPLEAEGDFRSRRMTVLDRIRAYRPARPRHPNGATGRIPVEPTRRIEYARLRWHSRHGDPDRRLRRNSCRVDPDTDRLAVTDSGADRKSTRLNSSHLVISYAVFCLKNTLRL